MIDRCENCIHIKMCKWTDEMVANHTCDWYREERPHGEWVQQPTMEGHTWYECSVCKSWIQDMSCYDYCPNCGASMKKEGQ